MTDRQTEGKALTSVRMVWLVLKKMKLSSMPRQTDRQRQTKTDTETDRQTDRQTDTERNRQTDRQRGKH